MNLEDLSLLDIFFNSDGVLLILTHIRPIILFSHYFFILKWNPVQFPVEIRIDIPQIIKQTI